MAKRKGKQIITASYNVGMSPEMLQALRQRANEMGLSLSDTCRLAYALFLERGVTYAKSMTKAEVKEIIDSVKRPTDQKPTKDND